MRVFPTHGFFQFRRAFVHPDQVHVFFRQIPLSVQVLQDVVDHGDHAEGSVRILIDVKEHHPTGLFKGQECFPTKGRQPVIIRIPDGGIRMIHIGEVRIFRCQVPVLGPAGPGIQRHPQNDLLRRDAPVEPVVDGGIRKPEGTVLFVVHVIAHHGNKLKSIQALFRDQPGDRRAFGFRPGPVQGGRQVFAPGFQGGRKLQYQLFIIARRLLRRIFPVQFHPVQAVFVHNGQGAVHQFLS